MSKEKPWFRTNSTGIGFHPTGWQGWLILVGVVVVIVCVILLIRGVL